MPKSNNLLLPGYTVYIFGGIDTSNPRVEIDLVDLEKEGLEKVTEILYNKYRKEE